ncbi:MAG: DUF885 domain-containing protein [Lachnospiraceae bacterium]|nr:DUF885 domain-containing protein [Lachnospiraceae bacterium]
MHSFFPHSAPRRLRAVFFLSLTVLSLILCSCGRERLDASDTGGQTGEFYTSDRAALPQTASQTAFSDFCTRVFKEEMEEAPTLDLHFSLLHPERYGIETEEVSLGTVSLSGLIAAGEDRKSLREELLQFRPEELEKRQQILFDALLEALDASLLGEGLELYEQPLAPTIGVQAQLPILLAEYAFTSQKDVEDYLALLSQIDGYYEQILEFERQKADAGLAPSDASIDAIIASCESYLIDPEENFLTETFEARLERLSGTETVSEGLKSSLRGRHLAAIREHFLPAYENLISGMTALKGRGIRDGGLCQLADGKKYYEYLLRSGPGLSYSVPELKKALEAQMEEDLSAISRLFSENPSLDGRDSDFSLSDPQQILDNLRVQMAGEFPASPDCSYEIRYVPKYLEDSLSPAFYLTAPSDDLNQNVIYINGAYSDGLYTTLAHEGFPGHLYQTVYARSHAVHPLETVLSCSGANEGWATYVENCACLFDNGLSDGVGEYRARARSFSLCVHGLLDIGINYEGWTLEQAKEFITAYFQADDAVVQELWQTMIDNPTNYLEYCGGYVEIMEMRRMAELQLGDRFSPLEFHRFLLDLGPLPFPVIRKYFSEWLDYCSLHD